MLFFDGTLHSTPNIIILEIKEEDGAVKMQVSKIGKRIQFLHQEPHYQSRSCEI